ncbi:VanZ family protein [Sutcliffiella cohnii]|uniref:VanZ family protein n=1 Tax=Sutcliffiella cohnii TaxID=33932 RepID=UPI002E218DC3|nr:VanZ family protein [Sutcliffiella cohnii]
MQRLIIPWLLVVAWMVLIFSFSAQPAEQSSSLSGGIVEPIIETIETVVPVVSIDKEFFHTFIRKNAHFFAYFILGVLSLHAFRRSGVVGMKAGTFALLLSVVYAISDEVHQLFVPGRSGEVRDVLIDSAGAFIGIVIYYCLSKLYNRNKALSRS